MGVSAQVSTTGFHGEGHMCARLIYLEYCYVPGVHGQNGRVCPGFHGEGHMGPQLIYMEYCSVPGVHGQNRRVCPGVHHRLPWGGTHGPPANLHGILFCTWGPREDVSAQVSTTGLHEEGHMGAPLINMEYCSVPGVHGQNGRVCPGVHDRLPWGGTHGPPANLHGILFCTWGPRAE